MLDLKAHRLFYLMLLIAAVRGFSVRAHATQTIQAAATLSPEGVPAVPYSLYLLFLFFFLTVLNPHSVYHSPTEPPHAHSCTCSKLPNPSHSGSCNAESWGCPWSSWFYLPFFSFFLLFLNTSQPTLGILQSHRTTSFPSAYTREAQPNQPYLEYSGDIFGISSVDVSLRHRPYME